MAEAIIDLCYNYTCEDSISGISRHYNDGNSFYEDFLNRLLLYWNEGKTGTHVFLAQEGNPYRYHCVPQKCLKGSDPYICGIEPKTAHNFLLTALWKNY